MGVAQVPPSATDTATALNSAIAATKPSTPYRGDRLRFVAAYAIANLVDDESAGAARGDGEYAVTRVNTAALGRIAKRHA